MIALRAKLKANIISKLQNAIISLKMLWMLKIKKDRNNDAFLFGYSKDLRINCISLVESIKSQSLTNRSILKGWKFVES